MSSLYVIWPSSSLKLLKILKGGNKVSPEPSFLQAEQMQLPQPGLTAEGLQPCDLFCGPTLDLLQWLFPGLRTLELDTVLQMGFLKSKGEGENHLPWPGGHASLGVVQDMADFLARTISLCWTFHLPASPSPSPSSPQFIHSSACIDTRGLSWLKCSTLYLTLLNFKTYSCAHLSH